MRSMARRVLRARRGELARREPPGRGAQTPRGDGLRGRPVHEARLGPRGAPLAAASRRATSPTPTAMPTAAARASPARAARPPSCAARVAVTPAPGSSSGRSARALDTSRRGRPVQVQPDLLDRARPDPRTGCAAVRPNASTSPVVSSRCSGSWSAGAKAPSTSSTTASADAVACAESMTATPSPADAGDGLTQQRIVGAAQEQRVDGGLAPTPRGRARATPARPPPRAALRACPASTSGTSAGVACARTTVPGRSSAMAAG